MAAFSLLTRDRQSFAWANRVAAEHITVDAADLAWCAMRVRFSSAIIRHRLPGITLRVPIMCCRPADSAISGGLSVLDFVKLISVAELSRAGLKQIAPAFNVSPIAEGLQAHADSIRIKGAPMLEARAAVRNLPTYIRHLVDATAFVWISTKTRWAARRESWHDCSAMSGEEIARYPEREPMEAVVAGYFGIEPGRIAADQRRRRSDSFALRNFPGTRR